MSYFFVMEISDQFKYPAIERHTREDGVRHYVCPETGIHVPSVTTILDKTSDKTFLVEWRKRLGDKEADRQSNYGKGLGSLVHENIENHILGIERPKGSAPMRVLSRTMADQIINKCLPDVNEIWGIETPLYYPGLFAGTSDLVGLYKNIPSMMDHKNAKKMRTKEKIVDYRDQLSAYIISHNAKYGTDIQQGVVFMVSRNLECQAFVWGAEEIKQGSDSFLNRVETYYRDHVA